MQHDWVLPVGDLSDAKKKLRVVREVVLDLVHAQRPGQGTVEVDELQISEDVENGDVRLACTLDGDHFYADCVNNHFSAVPKDGLFANLPTFLREIFLLATTPHERHAHAYAHLRSSFLAARHIETGADALQAYREDQHALAARVALLEEKMDGMLAREAERSIALYMGRKRKRTESEKEEEKSSRLESDDDDEESSRSSSPVPVRPARKYPRLDVTNSRQPSPDCY